MTKEYYEANGMNGGIVALTSDGPWVKVVWKNKRHTYETVVAVPSWLVKKFVENELGEVNSEEVSEIVEQ